MTVTKDTIRKQARRLADARIRVAAEEQRLSLQIWRFLGPRGSMRDVAKQLGISPQYLCDVAHQRRKVSDAVVKKVMAL